MGGDLGFLAILSLGCVEAFRGRESPGGDSLSFASPKESKQRKGDPTVRVPSLRYGQPALPQKNGGRRKLAALKQRAALIPFFWVITGPARRGGRGEQPNSHRAQVQTMNATDSIAACAYVVCVRGVFDTKIGHCPSTPFPESAPKPAPVPASPVLAEPVMMGKSGIRAARCLSRRRVCADPRFCPSSQVARSEAKGLRQSGRLSFAYFSLAKQRKVSCRRATPGLPTLQTSAAIPGTTSC